MKLIKTLTKFVAGSDKLFDVFEGDLEEVDTTPDAKGRKMLEIVIDGNKFKGLHNKKVEDYLYENEGSTCRVVLWRSGKGNHMVAYLWDLWEEALETDTENTIKEVQKDFGPKEAFLYLWVNTKNGKKYLGKHKGSLEDGYISSGELMLAEYEKEPKDFIRVILAEGSDQRMHELETLLLINLDAKNQDGWYNLSNNLRG